MFKRTLQSASARKRSGTARRHDAPPAPPAARAAQHYGQYTGGARAAPVGGGYAGQYGSAVAQGQYGAYTQGY